MAKPTAQLSGRPVMPMIAASPIGAQTMHGGTPRKISDEARARRSARNAFADVYGLPHDIRRWTPDQVAAARKEGWVGTREHAQADETPPDPSAVHASMEAGRAFGAMLTSNAATPPKTRTVRSQQPEGVSPAVIAAALRALGR